MVIDTVRNYTANYDKIWIYDKIHHEINQYCSKHTLREVFIEKFEQIDEELIEALKVDIEKWAPGIDIISVRVTKPIIPTQIKSSFEYIESTKAQVASVKESGKISLQKARNNVEKMLKDQRQKINLKKIKLEQELKEKENELEMAQVENEIFYEKEIGLARMEFVKEKVELNGLIDSLTDDMLEGVRIFVFSNSFDRLKRKIC